MPEQNSNYLFKKSLHPLQYQRLAYGVKIYLTFGLFFGANCLFAQGESVGLTTTSLSSFIQLVILGLLVLVVYLYFRRVREAKRLLQQLKVLSAENARLAQANQDLQHVNTEVMHDLKSPLRSISSFTNLFLRRYSDQLTIGIPFLLWTTALVFPRNKPQRSSKDLPVCIRITNTMAVVWAWPLASKLSSVAVATSGSILS